VLQILLSYRRSLVSFATQELKDEVKQRAQELEGVWLKKLGEKEPAKVSMAEILASPPMPMMARLWNRKI
jgi:hypothetical protein